MDWGSNASLPFVLPDMPVTPADEAWERPRGYPGSGQAIVTTDACTVVRDRLLRDPELEARQVLFLTQLGVLAAARMIVDTGGVGYLREIQPNQPGDSPRTNEIEVFTIFTPRQSE